MSWGERWAKLNRFQDSTRFKLAASAVVLAVAIGLGLWMGVARAASAARTAEAAQTSGAATPMGTATTEGPQPAPDPAAAPLHSVWQPEADSVVVSEQLAQRLSSVPVNLRLTIGAAIMLVVVWVGLAITYLGLAAVAALVVVPLLLWGGAAGQGFGVFSAGALALSGAFAALVRGVTLILSGSHPLTAVARNVVHEAVRLKLSLMFVALSIGVLAALPGLLNPETPLRYRVQSFIQYGMSASFVLAGAMAVFLAVASVAGEQRDKVIWQTMTKPVRAWQYVLGKWLGIVLIGAVMLGVSVTGIFLFTEYLRVQTAKGETAPFVIDARQPANRGRALSEDRQKLEYEVLTARRSRETDLPSDLDKFIDDTVAKTIEVEEARFRADPSVGRPAHDAIEKQVRQAVLASFYSVAMERPTIYRWTGLQGAAAVGRPMTLRFKVNFMNNPATTLLRLGLLSGHSPLGAGVDRYLESISLGQTLSIPISSKAINDQGVLEVVFLHGGPTDERMFPRNDKGEILVVPPMYLDIDTKLTLNYPVGGFRDNFLRAGVALWLKIGLLAAIGVCAGTFLSFPVASIVSFAVFMLAEGAGFLAHALNYFSITDATGKEVIYWKVPIVLISHAIAWLFKSYAGLSPVENLVQGLEVSWSTVISGAATVGTFAAVLVILATAIFRRRELAIYSGH